MRKNKLFAVLAALCMMGSLAACGDSSSKAAEASKSESSAAAKEESSEATTTAKQEETSAVTTTTTEEPLPTPADGAITFDTASLYGAVVGDDSGAAKCNLDVVDLDGDKKLRIQVLDKDEKGNYNIPKIIFDLPTLLGQGNVSKIGKISADFTCKALDVFVNEEGAKLPCIGNFLGTFGSQLAQGKKKDDEGNFIQNDWNQTDFSFSDWEKATHSWHFEATYPIKKLPINNYSDDEGTSLLIMRWGQTNQVDFYIDNLTFYDKDGKVMPIVYDAAANTVEVKKDTLADAVSPDKAEIPADSGAAADTTTTAAQ